MWNGPALSIVHSHREGMGEIEGENKGCNVFIGLLSSKVYCMQCTASITHFQ